jgi:TrkA domain protein
LEWYEIPPGSLLAGETIETTDIGGQTGVTVVAIERGGDTVASPGPDTTLQEGDTLVVIGTDEQCDAFEELLAGGT